MFDVLDLLLLRRGVPKDDRTLTFRRIDGNPDSRVVYFLPWHTSYGVARQAGFVPLAFLACYEIPPALVSSEPQLSVRAMKALVDDAERLLAASGVSPREALIIGLSVGSYPAMHLAHRIGARVCAVAAADRGDLMLWQSPATRIVKRRAIQKGYRLWDFAKATHGYHPIQNLPGLRANSVFVLGEHDPFIPPTRSAALIEGIKAMARRAHIVRPEGGHVKTLVASARFQKAMCPAEKSRRVWYTGLSLPALSPFMFGSGRADEG
jgi:hypothetical protein